MLYFSVITAQNKALVGNEWTVSEYQNRQVFVHTKFLESQTWGFGKSLWNPNTLKHLSSRHLTPAQFQEPLCKLRRPAEILEKNYIIITPTTLSREAWFSQKVATLPVWEGSISHTPLWEWAQKRQIVTRVFVDQCLLSSLACHHFTQNCRKKIFNCWQVNLFVTSWHDWMYMYAYTLDKHIPKEKALVSICRYLVMFSDVS